jgi:hypothetical protein
MSTYSISKTSFIKFEQCQKAFFLYKNHPYLRDKVSVDKQLTFKRGHDVGYFAQQLFPGGIDISKETKNVVQALELTTKHIEDKTPVIYEATFVYNGVLIMADILTLNEEGVYHAYEIKSSLKVSETYLKDAYLQYYVIKNVLPTLDDLFLVTLNGDYHLENEIDVRKLFKRRSVKLKAQDNFNYFKHRIGEAHALLEQNAIPNLPIGKHCFKPYQCDYFGTCWKDTLHEKSIFNLPLINKTTLFDWFESGIKNMDELSDEQFEKPHLLQLKNAILNNTPIINKNALQTFVNTIKQPAIALDMEIWNPAIPQLPGTKPFEQTPFLVCLYDGTTYSNFFTEHSTDQTELFAQKLIEFTVNYASVLVYDKTMEVTAIDTLAKKFPQLAGGLASLKLKIIDLFDSILNLHYYDPQFKSNFTLKGVASVVLKDVSYSTINSGLEAMNYYDQYRMATEENVKENIKQQLIEYCNTDCFATFQLAGFFKM